MSMQDAVEDAAILRFERGITEIAKREEQQRCLRWLRKLADNSDMTIAECEAGIMRGGE